MRRNFQTITITLSDSRKGRSMVTKLNKLGTADPFEQDNSDVPVMMYSKMGTTQVVLDLQIL